MARMLPVADRTGPLSDRSAGLRYDVAPSIDLVDLGGHDHDDNRATAEVDWMASGRYCGDQEHFPYISRKLAEAREKWNQANVLTGATADRVLGVVWQDVSQGAYDTSTSTSIVECMNGIGEISGTLGWSRLVRPFTSSTLSNPAQASGAIAGMEVMHTLGSVPSQALGYHSPNREADGTAPGYGYDTIKASSIPGARSLLNFQPNAWHDDNTLMEPSDWRQAACVLTSNPASSLTAGACTAPGKVGDVAEAAAQSVHLAGSTDGTPAGTRAHTYVAPNKTKQAVDPSSPYQLVFTDAAGAPLGRRGVPVSFTRSIHSHSGGDNTSHTRELGIFDIAIAAPVGTADFALVKTGTPDVVLYGRGKGVRPTLTSISAGSGGVGTPSRYATGPSGGGEEFVEAAESVVSDDGELVAWETVDGVAVRRSGDTTSEPLLLPGATDPAFAHTSSSLAHASADGERISIVTLDLSGAVPAVAASRVVYQAPRDPFGNLTDPEPVASPSFSPGDDRLVLAAGGGFQSELYIIPADGSCTSLLAGAACRRLSTGAHAAEPSWSAQPLVQAPDGLIAFTDITPYDGGSSSAVAVLNPAQALPSRVLLADDAAQPDWGGERLAFWKFNPDHSTQQVVTARVAAGALADLKTIADSNGQPSLTADDRRLAFSREELVAEELAPTVPLPNVLDVWNDEVFRLAPSATKVSAIYLLELMPPQPGSRTVTGTDDQPEQLRLDVLGVCGDRRFPLHTGVRPTSTASDSASFDVKVDATPLCSGGEVVYELTDGFEISEPQSDGTLVGANSTPSVALVSPRSGDSFLQHRSIPLAANARSASGDALPISYVLTGPTGTAAQGTVQPGEHVDLAALRSPGSYTLKATTTDPSGTQQTVSAVFRVLADADADGLSAASEDRAVHGCLPVGADADPRTAIVDYDGDLLTGPDDDSPCVSALNAAADFDANSIQTGSSGNRVNVYLTSNTADLKSFSASDVAITRLAGHPVNLRATRYSVDLLGRATAQFDRQAFQALITQYGLKGYVPVLVSGSKSGAAFSGIDPHDPTIK
jgi:hypothetical protein